MRNALTFDLDLASFSCLLANMRIFTFLLIPLFTSLLANGQGNLVREIIVEKVAQETADGIQINFRSTLPAGTSYRAQYGTFTEGTLSWEDIPDATVHEVEGSSGKFTVTAPTFGAQNEFFRIVDSQFEDDDPLGIIENDSSPSEILNIWHQPSSRTVNVNTFFYVDSPADETNDLAPYEAQDLDAFPGISGDLPAFDMLSYDADRDGVNEVLQVWAVDNDTPNRNLALVISDIDKSDLSFSNLGQFVMNDRTIHENTSSPAQVRVVEGNFGNDHTSVPVLAWTGSDFNTHIDILSFSENFNSINTLASFSNNSIQLTNDPSFTATPFSRSARIDIATGDLNNDGIDEIILVQAEARDASQFEWVLYVQVFEVNLTAAEGSRITAAPHLRDDTILYRNEKRRGYYLARVAVTCGNFDGDPSEEIAVAHHVQDNSSTDYWFIDFLELNNTLNTVTMKPLPSFQNNESIHQTTGDDGYPLAIEAYNLDEDPEDEVMYAGRQFRLYNVIREDGFLTTGTTFGNAFENPIIHDKNESGRRQVVMANVDNSDPNSGHYPEIISWSQYRGAENAQYIEIQVNYIDPNNGYRIDELTHYNQKIEGSNGTIYGGILVEDFGANGLSIGTPRRYQDVNFSQPLVILHGPPQHFDILEGEQFDLRACQDSNDPSCGFNASFTKSVTETSSLTSTFSSTWNVDVKVDGGFKIPFLDVGVEAEVRSNYGESLDQATTTGFEITETLERSTSYDDQIYSTRILYDIWEYPVILGDQIVAYIAVTQPAINGGTGWSDLAAYPGGNYRPYHELGNLLSYRSSVPNGLDFVNENRGFADAGTSSSTTWTYTETQGEATNETRGYTYGFGGTVSFDIPVPFIPNVEVNGDYQATTTDSFGHSFSESNSLQLQIGKVDGTIDTIVGYTVRPYLHWDPCGALVLDYAIEFPLGSGSLQSWWQKKYAQKSDPAFNLAFRYFGLKPGTAGNEVTRQFSRDIIFDPARPRPGETVTIKIRIRNFSLLATPSSMQLKIYNGDPLSGGVQLSNIEGEHTLIIPSIPARDHHIAEFEWSIPTNVVETFIPIYAVIDAANQIDEIHEDNNKGFNDLVLRKSPGLPDF